MAISVPPGVVANPNTAEGPAVINNSRLLQVLRQDINAVHGSQAKSSTLVILVETASSREKSSTLPKSGANGPTLTSSTNLSKPYDIFISYLADDSWSYVGRMCHGFARANPPQPLMNLLYIFPSNERSHRAAYSPCLVMRSVSIMDTKILSKLFLELELKWDEDEVYEYYQTEYDRDRATVDENVVNISRGGTLRKNLLGIGLDHALRLPLKKILKRGARNKENFTLSPG